MRRILVAGAGGSGKTSAAAKLARTLGVAHIEMDALNHGPNWAELTAEELRTVVARELHGRDGWVVDGYYHGKLGDFVLRQADTVVWLDLPLRTCLWRQWSRTVHHIRNDTELWSGNRLTWQGTLWGDQSLMWPTIRYHHHRRRVWPERFARLPNLTVIRLRSPAEVEAFLASPAASRYRGDLAPAETQSASSPSRRRS